MTDVTSAGDYVNPYFGNGESSQEDEVLPASDDIEGVDDNILGPDDDDPELLADPAKDDHDVEYPEEPVEEKAEVKHGKRR